MTAKKARPAATRKRVQTKTAAPPPEPPAAAPATLAGLLDALGPGVLEVHAAPGGLDGFVAQPVVGDRHDVSLVEEGDILLAVGVDAEGPAARDLVAELGARRAAAVVFRTERPPGAALLAAASSAGVAVLAAPGALAWGQLYSLLRTAGGGWTAMDTGRVAGVPLGDLFALANAVAAMVGGPTTIEDPQSRVLAYSSDNADIDEPRRQTILGRRVPDEWIRRVREAGVFRRLYGSDEVVRYEHPGLQPRLAVAVRAGAEVLGSLWVAEGSSPLGADAESALREASRIAALHLIRHRTQEDLDRSRRGELLQTLLDGRVPADAAAQSLGIDARAQVTVVAFEPVIPASAAESFRAERVADMVALYCESYRRQAALVYIGRTIYVLFPEADDPAQERLRRLVNDLIERARAALGADLRAGIGSTVDSLSEVVRSRWEADQVLRVLARRPERSFATVEEVRPQVVLRALHDLAAGNDRLRSGRLDVLREQDSKRGTAYLQTLGAYLKAFGDVPTAAASINVHPNSFRYRLRRLAELAALDLSDADERLAAELELRFSGHWD